MLSETFALRTPCVSRSHFSNDGAVLFVHTPDPAWDINDYFVGLHQNGAAADAIFWHALGLLHYFRCIRCDAWFPHSERELCRFCPQVPAVVSGVAKVKAVSGADFANDGAPISMIMYGCCGLRVPRFHINLVRTGCMWTAHDIDPDVTGASGAITLEDLEGTGKPLSIPAEYSRRRPNMFWEEECASEPPASAVVASRPMTSGPSSVSVDGDGGGGGDDGGGGKHPSTSPRKVIPRKVSKPTVPYVAAREILVHDNSYIAFGVRLQPPVQAQNDDSSMYVGSGWTDPPPLPTAWTRLCDLRCVLNSLSYCLRVTPQIQARNRPHSGKRRCANKRALRFALE